MICEDLSQNFKSETAPHPWSAHVHAVAQKHKRREKAATKHFFEEVDKSVDEVEIHPDHDEFPEAKKAKSHIFIMSSITPARV